MGLKLSWKRIKKKLGIKAYKTFWLINSRLPNKFKTIKKGAPKGARAIKLDEIIDILNGVHGVEREQYPPHRSTLEEELHNSKYKEDSQKLFEATGLEKHMSINESKRLKRRFWNNQDGYNNVHYDVGCEIIIENLIISMEENVDIKPDPYFSRNIVFKNNTFIGYKRRTPFSKTITYDALVEGEFVKDFGIEFENNIFINIGIILSAKSHVPTFINFVGNIFKCYTEIKTETAETITVTTDKNISILRNKASVFFVDNKVPRISLNINSPIYFSGINRIDEIEFIDQRESKSSNNWQTVQWGRYQKVTHTEKNIKQHKEFFITLKKIAEQKNDKSKNFILNREILKCDHYSITTEDWKTAWQDKIILWFGDTVSDHGISWIRPFGLLVAFNIALSFIIFIITGIGYFLGIADCITGFWYVLAGMFNPISNLVQTTGINNAMILFCNAIQKAVFALLLYEMIRVGRRFVAK